MIKSKYILWFSFAVFIFLTFMYSAVPFFWDGTFFSETASRFYDGSFSPFDCPANLDNTTFPVFSTYLFFVWKIFSRSLLVSHLAMLPFLLGICYEFYKLAKKFLPDPFVSFAMILLLLQPAFMTQSIIMGYDIVLVYLFLLALNFLLAERYTTYSLILPLIGLYSIRGMLLAFSLAMLAFIFQFQKNKFRAFIPFLKQHLLCVLFVAGWFIYHKAKTGWLIISPAHENTDEQLLSFSMMLKQALYIVWKLADFGVISLWLILVSGFGILYKNKLIGDSLRKILMLLFVPLVITSLFMILFSNPIGHRYFMFTFFLLIIAACFVLQQVKKIILRRLIFAVCCLLLLSGNYWMYGERYGNGWDSSLKVLPYFSLKNQMDKFITDGRIDPSKVGTQYPLIADKRYSDLADSSFTYTNVWRGPLNSYDYFLYSNVINTDIPEQIEKVKASWIPVKEMRSGKVCLTLYKNPGK